MTTLESSRRPRRVFQSTAELAQALGLGTPTAVRAGCALTTEGTPGRDAFIVVEGIARVMREGRLIAHVGPDEFVGEMALIDHGPRTASVVAATPMRVLTFDAPSFAALLGDPRLSRELRRQVVERLRATWSSVSTNQPNNRRNRP
jgi:CRP-like cAMP-binding protein